MTIGEVARRAAVGGEMICFYERQGLDLAIRSVPAVAADGQLAGCCAGRGPTEEALRSSGIEQDI